MDNLTIYFIFICIMSVFELILYAIDKYNSMHGKWRIREKSLFLVSFLGGALGAIFGMLIFIVFSYTFITRIN